MLNLSVLPAIRSGQRSGLSISDVSLAGPVDVGIRRGLGSFSIDGRVWDMRMPCQRAMLNNTTIYPHPFEREANCCLSANAISHKIVRVPSQRGSLILSFIAESCRETTDFQGHSLDFRGP